MTKYKPMLVHFDEVSYQKAIKEAEQKIHIYNKALAWSENHIKINTPKLFAESFTQYFKDRFYDLHKDKISLDISVDKILNLMDVNLMPLEALEIEFKKNKSSLIFKGDKLSIDVNRKSFEVYTRSSKQNAVLKDAKNLIDALNRLKAHTHIYPAQITIATSNLIGYNMQSNKYQVNLSLLQEN